MIDDKKIILQEILALLQGGNAHMNFDELVLDFPLDLINATTDQIPYSVWHLIEHMRIAQWDILEFIRNPDHVSPEYPGGYRPRADTSADEKLWKKTIEKFKKDLNTLCEMAADHKNDLYNPIPHAKDYNIFRELLVVADHNAYHMGEIAMLRQQIGAWPSDNAYLTGEGTAEPE